MTGETHGSRQMRTFTRSPTWWSGRDLHRVRADADQGHRKPPQAQGFIICVTTSLESGAAVRRAYAGQTGEHPRFLGVGRGVQTPRHFWKPPSADGDVIEGREISFLELCYTSCASSSSPGRAYRPAGDVTWAGVGRYAVVFGLIWLAWINGAVYQGARRCQSAGRRRYGSAPRGRPPGSRSPTPMGRLRPRQGGR